MDLVKEFREAVNVEDSEDKLLGQAEEFLAARDMLGLERTMTARELVEATLEMA